MIHLYQNNPEKLQQTITNIAIKQLISFII